RVSLPLPTSMRERQFGALRPSLDQQFNQPIEPLGAPASAVRATAASCGAQPQASFSGSVAARAECRCAMFDPITSSKSKREDMINPIRFFGFTAALFASALACAAPPANAQPYPSQPIKVIVPTAP